ncbi:MAG: hypothetical protein IKW01_03630, partial [Firmicutes bacterium]|nr:hypothetical protein [Bacillota bacterium]
MKKILCLILAVMMVFTMMPGMALAEGETPEKTVVFSEKPLLDSTGKPDGPLGELQLGELNINITKDKSNTVEVKQYAYIATYVNNQITAIEPAEGLIWSYFYAENRFDASENGMTITKADNPAAGNACYYTISLNSSAYNYFSEGKGRYDVKATKEGNVVDGVSNTMINVRVHDPLPTVSAFWDNDPID